MGLLLNMITRLRSELFALGLNVTRQTVPADVRGLLQKLRPQDCGIELIRVGGDADGGYLLPDDLDGIEYCFSPGVGALSVFESELADLHIKSFLADYSVDSPPFCRPEFTFDKKFLGSSDRGQYLTLATWKEKYLPDYSGDMILQMDIEGAEYEVILSTPDRLLDQFRIIVIEFHEMHRIFDPFDCKFFSACFEKLLNRFYVVHIHPNNGSGSLKRNGIEVPKILEFTFFNKKRVRSTRPQTEFPHRLDRDVFVGPSLPLPRCWYT
jgi:hypothetical protein